MGKRLAGGLGADGAHVARCPGWRGDGAWTLVEVGVWMGESSGGAEGGSGGPHSGFGVLGALEVWCFCSGGGPVGVEMGEGFI